MESLFIYPINSADSEYQNLYYFPRFKFVQETCKTNLTYVIIIYDSRYMALPNVEYFELRCKNVFVLDYQQIVLRLINPSISNIASPVEEWLRDYVDLKFSDVTHVYSYSMSTPPLTKLIVEAIHGVFDNVVFIEIEDGMASYVSEIYPQLFPRYDANGDKFFRDASYQEFLSSNPPRIGRERYFFALFYPELVVRGYSRQVDIQNYFCFRKAKSESSLVIEGGTLIVPTAATNAISLIEWVIAESGLQDKLSVAAHPRTFSYSEVDITLIYQIAEASGRVGIVPANDLTEHLVSLLIGEGVVDHDQLIAFDRDNVENFPIPVLPYSALTQSGCDYYLVLSPNYGNVLARKLVYSGAMHECIVRVNPLDLSYAHLVREYEYVPGKYSVREVLCGDMRFVDMLRHDNVSWFSPIVPMEFIQLDHAKIVSTISSVLYRLQCLNPGIESVAVIPSKGYAHLYGSKVMHWSQEKLSAIGGTFKRMGVKVVYY